MTHDERNTMTHEPLAYMILKDGRKFPTAKDYIAYLETALKRATNEADYQAAEWHKAANLVPRPAAIAAIIDALHEAVNEGSHWRAVTQIKALREELGGVLTLGWAEIDRMEQKHADKTNA